MSLTRRDFLMFMGAAIAARTVQGCTPAPTGTPSGGGLLVKAPSVGFRPLQGPTPLATSGIPIAQQLTQLATYEIKDDLVLPEG
jgi:uncharacterized protein